MERQDGKTALVTSSTDGVGRVVAKTLGARGARITGWGTSLPPTVVTNADFEARLDTSDAWITERTGIKERRHGGTTAAGTVTRRSRGAGHRGHHRGAGG